MGRASSTTVFAWSLWLVAVVFDGLGVATALASGAFDVVSVITNIALSVAALALVTVGAVLMTRLPRNSIGWLLAIGGFLFALSNGAEPVALAMFNGGVPGAIWIDWFVNLLFAPAIVIVALFVPLVFPTGRVPSPRWRAMVSVAIVAVACAMLQSAFDPFAAGTAPPGVQNPLALDGAVASLLPLLGGASTLGAVVCFPLGAASLVLRYRRAAGVERAQLRWFAAVAAIIAPAFAVALVTSGATSRVALAIANVVWVVTILGLALLPVAIGIAVLRYRLYEIDRLISRSVTYGALTLILGAVFVAVILLLQALLAPLTRSNELAVAGSTLLVAALFQPIRRRVQRRVDRRFNRAHYDAERAVAAFSARLRDEVDLDVMSAEMVRVIASTLEPESVTIWLRPPEGSGGQQARTGAL